MSLYLPPGYWLLRDQEDRESDEALRDLLAEGAFRACYVNPDGSLTQILPMEWVSEQGEALIKFACHHHFFKDDKGRWTSPIEGNTWFADEYRQRLIVIAEADDNDDEVGENAAPQAAPPLNAESPTPPSLGGRPPKNWDRMWRRVVSIANSPDGLPEDRSDLIRSLRNWMAETGQHVAGETTLKNKLRAVYDKKDVE